MMKRSLGLTVFVLLLAVIFVSGCAKKTVLKEEKEAAKESAAVEKAPDAKPAETPAAADKPAPKARPKEDVAVKERAEKEGAEIAAKEKEVKAEAAKVKKKAPDAGESIKIVAAAVPSTELYEFTDVHFDFDKFNLRDEARNTLKKHAEWFGKNKAVMIAVEGHCDERGTAEYNLALGERRANAAAKFLVDLGIDAKRIKTISYGEELPMDPGHNEEAWTKNRRAHIVVSGKK